MIENWLYFVINRYIFDSAQHEAEGDQTRVKLKKGNNSITPKSETEKTEINSKVT